MPFILWLPTTYLFQTSYLQRLKHPNVNIYFAYMLTIKIRFHLNRYFLLALTSPLTGLCIKLPPFFLIFPHVIYRHSLLAFIIFLNRSFLLPCFLCPENQVFRAFLRPQFSLTF